MDGKKKVMAKDNVQTVVRVERVKVFVTEGKTLVELTFDKEVPQFQKNQKTKVFEDVMTKQIVVKPKTIEELAMGHDDASFYIGMVDDFYTQRVMQTLLWHAKLTVDSEYHVKGEAIDGKALERDQWFTTFSKYSPCEKCLSLMQNC